MSSEEAMQIRALLFKSRTVPEYTISDWRQQELMSLADGRNLPAGVTVSPCMVAGLPSEWIDTISPSQCTVLYLHGGGYILGGCATHRNLVARVALAAGARMLLPEYRLAPENPYPAAVHDAIAAYRSVIARGVAPSSLVVMGDSSGGGLAAALLLSLRDGGVPLPAAAVLLSPWTDLTLSGNSYRTRATADPIDRLQALRRMAALYVPMGDMREPLVSPLFGDLRGLPPVLTQVGDHEVLLDDSVRFTEGLRHAGNHVELEIWPEMWHGWHMAAPLLPEANDAIARVGDYIRRHAINV